MRIVCYKAVFRRSNLDTYDAPFPPECPPDPDTEFVIFADVPAAYEYAGWQIRPAVLTARSHRRRSRIHKTMPHVLFPDADFTIYLDGNFTPITSPRALVDEYASDPNVHLVSGRNPNRTCLYDVAEVVLERRLDHPEVVQAQIERYRRENYPANNGLASTGMLLRRNSAIIRAFNELWWSEIDGGSHRDQLSFDYCRWKLGLPAVYFRGIAKESPHFRHRDHRFARDHPEFRWKPNL